jgi:nitrate/nitrite transporter NarK
LRGGGSKGCRGNSASYAVIVDNSVADGVITAPVEAPPKAAVLNVRKSLQRLRTRESRPPMTSSPSPAYPPVALAFTVWGLGAALYLIGFFQRVAPAVLTRELSTEFALTAAALGNLSAVYFYSYVAMQIPTGLLADHWGPRRTLTTGGVVAALGGILFGLADSYLLVVLGRLLVGGAVGVAFVSMLKLSTHWFDHSRFATITGLAVATGVIGAVSAGAPLRLAADAFGWRHVMVASGVVTALVALATWLLVRDDPGSRRYRSYAPERRPGAAGHSVLGGLRVCLRSRNTWLVFFINGAVAGAPLTFAGLWGVPFMTTHYGLSTATAAGMASLVLVAWAFGGPVLGALSDRMGERQPIYLVGAAIAFIGWIMVTFVEALPLTGLAALLIVIGLASAAVMIGFALVKETVPSTLAGTAGGVTNMGNMLGGMLLQPAVGWVLDRMWQGEAVDGVRVFDLDAYRAGFVLMLTWMGAAVALILFTRETHCRQLVR